MDKSDKEELSIPMHEPPQTDREFIYELLFFFMKTIKFVSLGVLALQNAGLSILMRMSRTQKVLFDASSAVLMAEIIKLVASLACVFILDERNLRNFIIVLKKNIIQQPYETLKVSVPSLIYLVQNNLLYVGATHLDAATCQVTYQLKILTTAMFSIAMLNKRLNVYQWISLIILFIGVALVQIAQLSADPPANAHHEQRPLVGLLAVVMACCLSGFAGVYFEKILKGSDISIWVRNVQLCVTSVPLGVFSVLASGRLDLSNKGFFYGYNQVVWSVIIFQALGGLIVAVVVKFADNILKGFATSLAIVLSSVLSVYIFDFNISLNFIFGASLVMGSIFLYSKKPSEELHKK